jgi:hypothetical protein
VVVAVGVEHTTIVVNHQEELLVLVEQVVAGLAWQVLTQTEPMEPQIQVGAAVLLDMTILHHLFLELAAQAVQASLSSNTQYLYLP